MKDKKVIERICVATDKIQKLIGMVYELKYESAENVDDIMDLIHDIHHDEMDLILIAQNNGQKPVESLDSIDIPGFIRK